MFNTAIVLLVGARQQGKNSGIFWGNSGTFLGRDLGYGSSIASIIERELPLPHGNRKRLSCERCKDD